MPEDERNRNSGKKTKSCCSNIYEKKTRTVVVKAKEEKIESYKDVSRIVLENMKKATTIQPEADARTRTHTYIYWRCVCVCV